MSNTGTMAETPLRIVDFHNHFVGPSFALTTLTRMPAGQRPMWEGINRLLESEDALLGSMDREGVAARVITGIGEVFLFPAALALIAEVAPTRRLGLAISLFALGGPVGSALALVAGGAFAQTAQQRNTPAAQPQPQTPPISRSATTSDLDAIKTRSEEHTSELQSH